MRIKHRQRTVMKYFELVTVVLNVFETCSDSFSSIKRRKSVSDSRKKCRSSKWLQRIFLDEALICNNNASSFLQKDNNIINLNWCRFTNKDANETMLQDAEHKEL